jgi:hypothetical protein
MGCFDNRSGGGGGREEEGGGGVVKSVKKKKPKKNQQLGTFQTRAGFHKQCKEAGASSNANW